MTNQSRSTLSAITSKLRTTYRTIKRLISSKSKGDPLDIPLPLPGVVESGEWKKHLFISPAFNQPLLVPNLAYYIYTPEPTEQHPTTKGMPLVVMLHGCTQNPHVFAEGTKMNLIAQQEGFVVLYPEQSMGHNIAKCWRWFDLSETHGMAEANTLMEIIRSTVSMHDLDPNKVFVAGLSAGGGMSSILGAYFPDEIRAIAMHSSPMLGKAHDMKSGIELMRTPIDDSDEQLMFYLKDVSPKTSQQIPAMIIQGLADEVVSEDNANALTKQFLYLNNLDMKSKGSTTKYHGGTPDEYTHTAYPNNRNSLVELIKIKSLNHAWSGGDEKLPFNCEHCVNASAMIWNFFKKYS